eukprot:4437782-Amphidinium_carterae.1
MQPRVLQTVDHLLISQRVLCMCTHEQGSSADMEQQLLARQMHVVFSQVQKQLEVFSTRRGQLLTQQIEVL